MLLFNLDSYPLTLALNIYVFVQVSFSVSISETFRNFQCVNFHRDDTASLRIVLLNVPGHQGAPVLIYKGIRYDKNYKRFNHAYNNNSDTTYYDFENVNLQPLIDGSTLKVKLQTSNGGETVRTVIKFILENDRTVHTHQCTSFCKIEFDDWNLPSYNTLTTESEDFIDHGKAAFTNTHQMIVKGYQFIKYKPGDTLFMERVILKHIPHQAQFVDLVFNIPNKRNIYNEVVEGVSHEFTYINQTLYQSANGHAMSIKLKDQNKNMFRRTILAKFILDEARTGEFLIVVKLIIQCSQKMLCPALRSVCAGPYSSTDLNGHKATKKHQCLNKCILEYDMDSEYDSEPSPVCPKVQVSNANTTMNSMKYIRHDHELSTTKPTKRTTTTTERATTDTPTGLTVELIIISITLSAIAVGVVILIAVVFLYKRYKVPKPVDNNTYLYVTQLNYAQLQLESSELYVAPKKDYVSTYTRIIGVLRSK